MTGIASASSRPPTERMASRALAGPAGVKQSNGRLNGLNEPMAHATKERLLKAGLSMLLERGYNDLGIQQRNR